ncbi:MAG: hypothetical protein J6S85_06530 [Methanobrevibacter sp.]|nr:hypothetical protein [Methanobrevibacter sp.]
MNETEQKYVAGLAAQWKVSDKMVDAFKEFVALKGLEKEAKEYVKEYFKDLIERDLAVRISVVIVNNTIENFLSDISGKA